ncbi:PREDICTED: uncharacterized protein At4g04775-like [Brassica oleracea var. oleracea]|uniref:GRF-type domain-containing protein n=1 Tax=Brassica oleracea var. oleracea TaxID=109376 RepID=A0A0D3CFN6_BRAOL|nr:PREDICTED: uncharacterized protein At4g04775-like [Brassica oleracea var. oleracea]
MSDESGNLREVSSARSRGRVVGLPKKCWCGELVIPLISKSTANRYRRYFRCDFAVEIRLTNDNHTYKWVNEAFLDEVEALSFRIGRLEQTILAERVKEERKKFEELKLKLETEICARMEDVVSKAKCEVNKTLVPVVLGCLIMVVLSRVI